jgi:1-acyl-sn-glycerol-3-phosphate acyltransferase
LIGPLGRLTIVLRLAVMLAWLIGCILLYYLWRALPRSNPWPRIFLGGIAWLAGIDVRTDGPRAPRGTLFLANHVSWIDIPAMAGATGTAFVAHDGLAGVPFVHWLCRMNDTVFVARHDRTSVARQIEQVREAIKDTGALTIFPEGTTSDGADLLPFKSSLLAAVDPLPAGITVQPVWLDYGAEGPGIAWVGTEPGLDNFLRVLARWRPIALTVHFLPALSGEALASRKTISAAAQAAILAAKSSADARTAR